MQIEKRVKMSINIKENLILAVRDRNAIWDAKNKHHLNRYVLNNCWKEISKLVDLPAAEASKLWKNLRQEFKKQLKKARDNRSRDGASGEMKSSWPYFKSMLFLIDQFEPRKISRNLFITAEDNSALQSCDDSLTSIRIEPSHDEDPIADDSQQQYFARPSSSLSTLSGYDNVSIGATFPQFGVVGNNLNEQNLDQEFDENDEDIGFFNSLLPHVKKLPPKKKFKFRMKTQKTLYNLLYAD